jgi:lactate permease
MGTIGPMELITLALAGSLPIAAVFILLVGLRWSAAKAMGIGWILATGLGFALWRIDPLWWAASAVYGALQAMEIIIIVFGAILLMSTLKASGAIATIRGHFKQVSADARVQVLLIGLGFITLMEGASGFGTPGALAAPLLIGLGFPPMAAAVFGLFFDAPVPPFGAAGTPIIGGIGAVVDQTVLAGEMTVPQFLQGVTAWTGVLTGSMLAVWGLVGVFLMLLWFGHEGRIAPGKALKGTLQVAPFALLLGIVAGGTQFAVAWFFGPELPDIAAGFAVLAIGSVLAHRRLLMPAQPWHFPAHDRWPLDWLGGLDAGEFAPKEHRKHMPEWLAWTPYLLVALVLLLTRWPGLGVMPVLRAVTVDVPGIFGQELTYSMRYLALPGVLPFIPVAVITLFLHRMSRSDALGAWKEAGRQIVGPALTLVIAVSMTQIMIQSSTNTIDQPGMMEALSQVLALGAGRAIPFIAPWIGALGAFMTGSSTSSNILFSVLQHDAAGAVGLSRTLVVALQNVGSGLGNMVSVLNLAAIAGVTGMTGREGDMMQKTIVPMVLFGVLVGAAGLAIAFVLD